LIGKTLAHYQVTALLGKGGMGEVYRARDTKLNRDVALKLLPSEFSGDPERLMRFEREATTLASLQHANVASIYGFEHDQGRRFLIMELVEGQELAERLEGGRIPVEEAIDIALQIAEGLEVAHAQGIVHRDLKPANIKITPTHDVKILDFGLARAYAGDSGDGSETEIANSPTITAAVTQAGVILGTAAYMSPEQARGRAIDKQTDVWSFGVVLYEMLTGDRLFEGETISDSIGAILHREPDLDRLPAVPAQIHTLLRHCLARDKKQRLRDIGDARIALEEAKSAPASMQAAAASTGSWTRQLPWLIAAAAVAALGTTLLLGHDADEAEPTLRFTLSIPEDRRPNSALPRLELSPNAGRLVYVGTRDGDDILYVRDLALGEDRPLEGTAGAQCPFFSPDGEWIAFTQEQKLKKISAMGGPPVTLCDARRLRGGHWGPNDKIVFTPDRAAGLLLVSASGGTPDTLTSISYVGASFSEPTHRWPQFLPGGEAVIFTASENNSDYHEASIVAVSLADGSQKTIVPGGSFGRFVPGGFLVFARDDALFGVRFDPEQLESLGSPVPVMEGVGYDSAYGYAFFTFSETGMLVYEHDTSSNSAQRLVWLDRNGMETEASAHVRAFRDAAISPDQSLVAIGMGVPGRTDIWILELERDTLTRLTFDGSNDINPRWSHDGEWIFLASDMDGAPLHIHRKRSNGVGEIERITTEGEFHEAFSQSPDGKIILMTSVGQETGMDVSLLHLESPARIEPFLETPFFEIAPDLSPDGRWVAYASNESGQYEIYAVPLHGSGARVKISTNGGGSPNWNPTSNEILYVDFDANQMMSVKYRIEDDRIRPELPTALFALRPEWQESTLRPDGTGWLVIRDVDEVAVEAIQPSVVLNWTAELEAKVPKR
jgi:serine/threonine-protein kinase